MPVASIGYDAYEELSGAIHESVLTRSRIKMKLGTGTPFPRDFRSAHRLSASLETSGERGKDENAALTDSSVGPSDQGMPRVVEKVSAVETGVTILERWLRHVKCVHLPLHCIKTATHARRGANFVRRRP